MQRDSAAARARLFVETLTCGAIAALGARRNQRGKGEGARAPASLAGPAMLLEEIIEHRGDGVKDRLTPIGYKTARRRLPSVLEDLEPTDRRRRAAVFMADAIERIGAAKSSQFEGSVSLPGVVSDGGATTGVARAVTTHRLQGAVNAWTYDEERRRFLKEAPLVVMQPAYKTATRKKITAWAVAHMTAVDGAGLGAILDAHAWKDHPTHRAELRRAALEAFDRIADEFYL